MAQNEKGPQQKARKPYQKPAIVHTEKAETRAVQCSKAGDSCGSTGPLLS